jgi:hypothetical protein
MSDDASLALDEDNATPIETRQAIALEFIRETGASDSDTARAVGIDRSTLYRWRQTPEFREQYKAARTIGVDRLVEEAWRRAMRGSDRLVEFLLKAHKPEVYGDRSRLDLGNADGQPLQITDTEAAARISKLLAAVKARKDAAEAEDEFV